MGRGRPAAGAPAPKLHEIHYASISVSDGAEVSA
jgi:hypothetical protein